MWIEIAVASVAHAVNVARRREAVDPADVVVPAADHHIEVGVEEFVVFGSLNNAKHAPGGVVVDSGGQPGPPDQGNDRERAVGLDVQRAAAVVVGRAEALLGGEQVRCGEVSAQLLFDELGRGGPVGWRGHVAPNGLPIAKRSYNTAPNTTARDLFASAVFRNAHDDLLPSAAAAWNTADAAWAGAIYAATKASARGDYR